MFYRRVHLPCVFIVYVRTPVIFIIFFIRPTTAHFFSFLIAFQTIEVYFFLFKRQTGFHDIFGTRTKLIAWSVIFLNLFCFFFTPKNNGNKVMATTPGYVVRIWSFFDFYVNVRRLSERFTRPKCCISCKCLISNFFPKTIFTNSEYINWLPK